MVTVLTIIISAIIIIIMRRIKGRLRHKNRITDEKAIYLLEWYGV